MPPSWWARARRSAWSAATGPASRPSSRCWWASPPRSCATGATSGCSAPSATCPRPPCPGGLGLEPTGFSHILSARGLDVLDDALGRARKAMADDPSTENIELFTDLQEQFQTNGGYEAESVMARLADGLGLRQELLLEDIDSLSGGQRRRVDLMRVLFQEPELMILDEPTNHLDRSAKRWLLDELARFPGALLVVSHDLKLLDRSITKVLHIANQRLTEWKGNYSKFQALHEADQSQRERASELEKREISRLSHPGRLHAGQHREAGPQGQVAGQAGRADRGDRGPRSTSGSKASSFKLPTPPRSGAIPLEVAKLGVRYGSNEVLDRRHLPRRPGRPHRDHRAQRRRQVQPAALPGRRAGADQRRGRVRGQRRRGLLRPGARADRPDAARPGQRERRRAQAAETERRALLGSFGLPSKAADQLPATLSGGERAKLGSGHALGRGGQPACCSTSRPTTSIRRPSPRSAPCSATGPARSSR